MAIARLSAVERKQAIVDCATVLFAEKGFRGVTTRELAHAVGVSEPVLYQHFSTKRDLYEAIIESKTLEVEASIGGQPDLSLPDQTILLDLSEKIWRWHDDDATLSRLLLFSALEGHEFSDIFFARHASRFFEGLRRYFESRIEEGKYRPVDPGVAAFAFIGMIKHYSMAICLHHFDPDPKPRKEVIRQMVDLFLNGIQEGNSK